MNKIIAIFLTLLLFVSICFGQSSNNNNDKPHDIPFRPDIKLVLDTIDLKHFIGTWKSIDGNSILVVNQNGLEFLMSGNYFPGVSKYGDRAILSFSGRLDYVMNQGKRVPINTSQKGATVGYRVSITLKYENSDSHGGGGNGVAIAYSPEKNHLIVGCPPISKFENGQWTSSCGSFSSNSIYGKEFKKIK